MDNIHNWDSLDQFFSSLNNSIQYVVLRNYEDLDEGFLSSQHPDIDFLCSDRAKMILVTRSFTRSKKKGDVSHRAIYIRGKKVDIDIRCVGDGYYDTIWEKEILRSRELYNGKFYVPSFENYYYSLLYHALFQKRSISSDYKSRLSEQAVRLSIHQNDALSIETLQAYMRNKNYKFVFPENPATIANFSVVDKRMVDKDYGRYFIRVYMRAINSLKKIFK